MSVATGGPTGQPGMPPGTPSGPRSSWLGPRLLVILLVISAALNLCFVAGAAWTHWHAHTRWAGPEQRYQRMAAELDLDPQQRIGFDAYVAAMRARTAKMHQQVAPLIGSAWEELAKPAADGAQVMRAFDEAAEKRREFQREASAETLKFLALLSPAQRGKFIQIARERRNPGWRPKPPKQ